MKGLNVKRIAAIGLGAALVGSALAPAVMAGVFTNLDTLQKSDVISASGTPVVDIVVGTKGMPEDVIWAGNIAAKVAQMAVVPVSGSTDAKTVDLTVGGTLTTTGSGNTDENTVLYKSLGTEFNPIKADYSDSSAFQNISGRTIKNANVDSQINIDENVSAVMDVVMQSIADGIAPGEDTAQIAAQGIVYSINLGTGLPYYTSLTQLDDNSQYNAKIPIMGQEYVVDEATATKLVLYSDTTAQSVEVGQSLTVPGTGSYAGKDLTLTLEALTLAGIASSYKAQWTLKDGTTVLSTKEASAPYEIKDLFGTDYFNTSVYMSAAGLNASTNKYYATVRTGNSRLEIRNNEVFPYVSGVTNPQWKAYLTTSATGVNGSNGVIKYIQIKNNWSYLQTKTEQANLKFVLKAGDSVNIADYAKVIFTGR